MARCGAAGGLSLENRDGVGGVRFHVREDFEARARNRHAALGAEEFQARSGAASGAGFAEGIGGGEAGVLEQGVLRVGRLAVVLQGKAAAAWRQRQWTATPITHCTMSIACAPRLVIWPPE